ncbi:MAG: hypothetical protein H0W64_11715 [Gammaproteobacteria bacterium]|nr:hypothetical protein [Gammaproteobacteria bacterium]
MSFPRITVYNKQAVTKWQQKIKVLDKKILELRQSQQESAHSLLLLSQQLSNVLLEKNNLELQFQNNQIANAQYYSTNHSNDSSTIRVMNNVGGIFANLSTIALQQRHSNLSQQEINLNAQINACTKKLNEQKSEFWQTISRQSQKTVDVRNANTFLKNLETNPELLVRHLIQRIEKVFSDFEDQYPNGQNAATRLCLYQYQKKLKILFTTPESAASHHSNSIKYELMYDDQQLEELTKSENQKKDVNYRIIYLRLCGYLEHALSHFVLEEDYTFADQLRYLLQSTHIALRGDLPDSFKVHTPANILFNRAKTTLFDITETELKEIEKKNYEIESQKLTQMLKGTSLLENKIAHSQTLTDQTIGYHPDNPDYKFHTHSVQTLQETLNPHTCYKAGLRLNTLKEKVDGVENVPKEIAGVFATIAGIAIIAGSIAGLIVTFGTSALPSAFGIAIGLTIVESQITLGLSFSLIATLGAGLTFFGVRHCQAGKLQGLSKDFSDIQNCTKLALKS